MITQQELIQRATTPLESVRAGCAEYLRIWRARRALGLPTRRDSQHAMLKRRAKSKA